MNDNPYRSPVDTNEERGPVKINAYGVFPMTRRGYLILQGLVATAALMGLVAARTYAVVSGNSLGFISDYAVEIFIFALLFESAETAVMLSKFKKAERERAK